MTERSLPVSAAPKETALFDLHLELGAKMVDFAGYQMDIILKAAHEAATPEQSEALAEYADSFLRR